MLLLFWLYCTVLSSTISRLFITAKRPKLQHSITGKVYTIVRIPEIIRFETIGKVKIYSKILAEGNYGRIYLTDAKSLSGEKVVVKIPKFVPHTEQRFRKDHRRDPLRNFENEIDALKKMGQHVDDKVLSDGRVVIAMKLVKGSSIKSFIHGGNIKTKDEFRQLIISTNKAIDKMHSKGIVHNDIHLDNIMVEKNTVGNVFTVTMVDFGSAEVLALQNLPRFFVTKEKYPLALEFNKIQHRIWRFGLTLKEIFSLLTLKARSSK